MPRSCSAGEKTEMFFVEMLKKTVAYTQPLANQYNDGCLSGAMV